MTLNEPAHLSRPLALPVPKGGARQHRSHRLGGRIWWAEAQWQAHSQHASGSWNLQAKEGDPSAVGLVLTTPPPGEKKGEGLIGAGRSGNGLEAELEKRVPSRVQARGTVACKGKLGLKYPWG